MSNPLFNGNTSQQMDINKMFAEFKKNPVEYLARAKFNIPTSVGSNPQEIGNYLMQSGQVNNNMLSRIQQIMPNFKGLF